MDCTQKHSRSYYIGRKYAGNGRKNIPQAAKSKLHVQFYTRYYLSSLESSNDRIELLEAGASDFVLKPFNPQELKIRVRNLLR